MNNVPLFSGYNFTNGAQKELGKWVYDCIFSFSNDDRISTQPAYAQLTEILGKKYFEDITYISAQLWLQSREERKHALGGYPSESGPHVIVSCFPTSDIQEIKEKHIRIRYPFFVSQIMSQFRETIFERGFIHIMLSVSNDISRYNIDFFSFPSPSKLIESGYNKLDLVIPRKEYLTEEDAADFNAILSIGMQKYGVV
jgi:hypothetical protein